MRNENGFTLIELVVVIVILGILAAVAVPKFVDMQQDARVSTVRGLEGAVRSAAALAHAQALVKNQAGTAGEVTIEGVALTLAYGYPISATPASGKGNIEDIINISGFTYTDGATGKFDLTADSSTDDCYVNYAAPTAPNTAPAINVTATCD